VRSCALAARATGLSANIASTAFAVVGSGERLALKSVIGEVTLAKLPLNGVPETNASLKIVRFAVARAKRLDACGERTSVPPSVMAFALIEGACVAVTGESRAARDGEGAHAVHARRRCECRVLARDVHDILIAGRRRDGVHDEPAREVEHVGIDPAAHGRLVRNFDAKEGRNPPAGTAFGSFAMIVPVLTIPPVTVDAFATSMPLAMTFAPAAIAARSP
jgi:hypothetical protein